MSIIKLRVVEPTAEQVREAAKAARTDAISTITVTTSSGNTFDGDEVSQGRMGRAVSSLRECDERLAAGKPLALPTELAGTYKVVAGQHQLLWVLADNSAVYVSADELSEALVLAGATQTARWVL